MSRKKMKKARPFENLMLFMLHGEPVTKDEVADSLGWNAPRGSGVAGPKIYNISSYIWDIKNIPQVDGRSIVVRSIRDGKKVTAYQIVNIDDAKAWLVKRELLKEATPSVEVILPPENLPVETPLIKPIKTTNNKKKVTKKKETI